MKTEKTKKMITLEGLIKGLEELVEKGNKAISAGRLKAFNDVQNELVEVEKEYAKLAATIVYDELLKQDNPIEAAIRKYCYGIIKHREVKSDDKSVIGLELVERERQIDLLAFCEYSHRFKTGVQLNSEWQYNASKLNQLMCLRAAKTLKCSDAEIKHISDTDFLKEQARRIEMGETPISDTQIAKALQSVIDQIIFADDGKGGNQYKCNSHDVAYMLGCYTKKGKKALSLAVAKDGFFRLVIMEICLRILENGRYTVYGYKTIKQATA